MLRIGASIAEYVPLISALLSKEAKKLDEKAEWIGDSGVEGQAIRQLALGGPEQVREGELYRLVDDGQTDV